MTIVVFLVLSLVFKAAELVSFDQCGVSVNCLTHPSGCTSFESCNAVAQYYYNGVTLRLEIQLYSTKKWVGFGQVLGTAPNQMTNLYGAYCIKGSNGIPKFGLFKAPSLGVVNYINTSNVAYVNVSQTAVNGSYFSCSYSRPLDVGMYADSLLSLNDTQYKAVLAYGNSLTNDELLMKHDGHISTDNTINWTMMPSNPTLSTTTLNTSRVPTSSGFNIKTSIVLIIASYIVFLLI